jgi:hypothetical protein
VLRVVRVVDDGLAGADQRQGVGVDEHQLLLDPHRVLGANAEPVLGDRVG